MRAPARAPASRSARATPTRAVRLASLALGGSPPFSAYPAARYDHRLMDKIRVVLAEDNVLLREGLARLVSATAEFEVTGTASSLPQLVALVRDQQPNVVMFYIRMPPTGTNAGIQAAAWM